MIPFWISIVFITIGIVLFIVGLILDWHDSQFWENCCTSFVFYIPMVACLISLFVTISIPTVPESIVSKEIVMKQNEDKKLTYLLTKNINDFWLETECYYFVKENNNLKAEKIHMSKSSVMFTNDTPHIEIFYCGKEYQAKLKKWSIIGYLFKTDYSDKITSYVIYLPEGSISDELYAEFLE